MGARIFIVEDEQIVAADLDAQLRRLGHQVIGIAASGEEAMRLAEQLRPELVLMHVRIQGDMDGTEAARPPLLIAPLPILCRSTSKLCSPSPWDVRSAWKPWQPME